MLNLRRTLVGCIAIAGILTVTVSAAHAQADASKQTIERARTAIEHGDVAEGERLLATIDEHNVDRNDLDFLRGAIAVIKKDYATAIARFKAILNRAPSLNRVRLELARAYFLKGDDVAAEHYFRAAEAQGVPPEVQKNIDKFLDQIRRRKHWDANVALAVAPDTNINAATTAQSVDLFGLPFELNNAARQKSGVGVTGNFSGSYQWDVAANTKFKVGTAYYDTEYGNQAFTDRNLNLYAGPRFLIGQGLEVSVLATGSKRWYGGDAFTSGAGGRVEGRYELSPRILLEAAIAAQQLNYDAVDYAGYTGPVVSANSAITYAFDAHSFMRGIGGVVREQTQLSPLRDMQYIVGAGYYRENLPQGFAVYVGAQATAIRYDAPLADFGITRHDAELDYRFSISNKRIDIHGFTPVISYFHTDRYSNIALYAYHRNRGEIGVTRNF